MGRRAVRSFQVGIFVLAAGLMVCAAPARAGQVELVSRRDPGSVAPELIADARYPAVSADGRWVAFESFAPNLATGQVDANGYDDVFLLDRLSGTVTLVSHSVLAPATTGTAGGFTPSISADGRYVVFRSASVNLISGQTRSFIDTGVFLYDRDTGVVTLVSHKAGSAATSAGSVNQDPVISKDGSTVVFVSLGLDLVAGMTDGNGNSGEDVFAWDRDSGTVSLISHSAASTTTTANRASGTPRVSADGRYVLFESEASDLVSGQVDPTLSKDVFLHDRMTGTTVLVSRQAGTSATCANALSGLDFGRINSISDDGAYAVFTSYATNLVAGQTDTASTPDAFLFERATGTVSLVSHADGAAATAAGGGGASLSGDGAWIAFESAATNIVPGQADANGAFDVFLRQRATGATALVSHTAASATTSGNAGWSSSQQLHLSGDGRYLLFQSPAADLVAGQTDTNGVHDVFLYDRVAGTSTLVSHAHGSAASASNSTSLGEAETALSDGGAWAVFQSSASDLTAEPDPGARDLFLHERASGTNLAVTYGEPVTRLTPKGRTASLDTSRDGRYIALASQGTDLVAGQVDAAETSDVFLVDRLAGTTRLVSHAAGAPATAANRESGFPWLSDDGAWAVFDSRATDLIPDIGSPSSISNVYLYSRDADGLTLVSRQATDPGKAGNDTSLRPKISGDGRYVAFLSQASNLVSGQVDLFFDGDAFLYDRVTGSMTLVSHKAGDPLHDGNGQTSIFQDIGLSRDGRWVLFPSNATDLVSGLVDGNAGYDLFLWDRVTGSTALVTRSASSPTTTANAPTPLNSLAAISPDGRYVAFLSTATNLVSGQVDANGADDLFLFDRVSGTVTLITRQSGTLATTANAATYSPRFSDDGLFVVFPSLATNLVPGQVDVNQDLDAFLYDISTGTLSLLSPDGVSTDPASATFPSGTFPASAGARRILLASGSMSLVPGQVDVNGAALDLFLLDRATGTRKIVDRSSVSHLTTANNEASSGWLRSGGELVVFISRASDLAPGDFNGQDDVFVYTAGAAPASDYYTVTPCRALDTRPASSLSSGTAGLASLHGVCGVPNTAVAVAVNVTVIGATGSGNLRVYPGDVDPPTASTINFQAGVTRANNAMLPLAYDGSGTLGLLATVTGGGTVHVAMDVVGYYQ